MSAMPSILPSFLTMHPLPQRCHLAVAKQGLGNLSKREECPLVFWPYKHRSMQMAYSSVTRLQHPSTNYRLQKIRRELEETFRTPLPEDFLKLLFSDLTSNEFFFFSFIIFIFPLLPRPEKCPNFCFWCVCACSQRGGPHTDPNGSLLRSSVRPRLCCRLPRVSPAQAGFAGTCKIKSLWFLSTSGQWCEWVLKDSGGW